MATVAQSSAGSTQQTKTLSSCKCTSQQCQIIFNLMDIWIGIAMVIRAIDFFRVGQFDLIMRAIWSFVIGVTLIIMVFFVFRLLYNYVRFLLTFLGRGLVYLFFASVIGSTVASDTFGIIIYWTFYIIGFANIAAHFTGICGLFPLRYPRPFFNSVNIGGQKMGVDLDKNDPQKNQPIDDGADFGNAGAPSQAAPKSKELSNPFEGNGAPDGGAYGGNQV